MAAKVQKQRLSILPHIGRLRKESSSFAQNNWQFGLKIDEIWSREMLPYLCVKQNWRRFPQRFFKGVPEGDLVY